MAFDSGENNRLPLSEINVTPLVDVMLVLLIIFMITAPMMLQGVDVKLPKVDSAAMRTKGEHVVITLNANGEIFIDEFKTPLENLGLKVKRVMEVRKTDQVYLRADEAIPYGRVARIMGAIRRAGITNLGLVTEPEQVAKPKKR